jgi:hypothetical protein
VFGGVGDVYLYSITSSKEIFGRSGKVDDEGFRLDVNSVGALLFTP